MGDGGGAVNSDRRQVKKQKGGPEGGDMVCVKEEVADFVFIIFCRLTLKNI
jgi:hypothetical protein